MTRIYLLGLLLLTGTMARADLSVFDYRVRFPPPPTDGVNAVNTLDLRSATVIKFLACGDEVAFLKFVEDSDSSEDILTYIIAKVSFLTGAPALDGHKRITDVTCKQTVRLHNPVAALPGEKQDVTSDEWASLNKDKGNAIEIRETARFFGQCSVISDVRDNHDFTIDVDYSVGPDCMKTQVNQAVLRMSVKGQLGSSGLPCINKGFSTEGEWDVSVRDLIRVYYLDTLASGSDPAVTSRVLQQNTRDHIVNDLIILGSHLGSPSYSWLQCGNTENVTGSPRDRADERDWADDTWDDIWNGLKWLFRRLVYAAIVFLAADAAALTFGLSQFAAGLIAAALALGGTFAEIPESENHRMMIETSRYLNNQIVLADLRKQPTHPNIQKFEGDQEELRIWLSQRMQQFLKGDFEEYNARPYQRYTLTALLNLQEFSLDQSLKTGAQLALEYSAAKFALGSNQGRRVVPFRRLTTQTENLPLFDLYSGFDHSIALMLLYAGQTQQMRDGALVSETAPAAMIYAATSTYAPSPITLDIAIRKDQPYYERIHHTGVEIYTSRKGFLLSAGGITTGPANELEIAGVDIAGKGKDSGAAVPTVLIPSAGRELRSRDQFIRIEGEKSDAGEGTTRDHNICLWEGFACGMNIVIPPAMQPCLRTGPPGTPDQWRFLDSTDAGCTTLSGHPEFKFYAVVYREACPNSDYGCGTNWGFIEAVDSPAVDYQTFQNTVLSTNPPGSIIAPSAGGSGKHPINGSYRSFAGHKIEFDVTAHQRDSDKWGISKIDGADQGNFTSWELASGSGTPVMKSSGNGIVEITNLRLNQKLILDFSVATNPTEH